LKNKTFTLLIIFICIAIVFYIVKNQYSPIKTRAISQAPDIELTDIHKNNKLRLSELKGSVVFINFWASWCQPCIDEIPSIEGLFRHLSENSRFKMITILYRDNADDVLSHIKEMDYTFPIYIDPKGSAAKQFGITGVPETFIIDKKGNLRNKIIGPFEWDSPSVIETLLNLTNE